MTPAPSATPSRPWLTGEARFDRMLEPHGHEVLRVAALAPGWRVLDAGCGTGGFTAQVAAEVGPSGRVVGVDLDAATVARARARTADRGNIDVLVGDLQTADLGEDYFDAVVARFGTHLCADPVAAHRNLARSLRPGGRLATVVWAEAEANSWHGLPGLVLPAPVPVRADGGPFALADSGKHRDILEAAGFEEVELTRFEHTVLMGRDVDDAIAWFDATFGALLDATYSAGEAAASRSRLRELLAPHAGPAGVELTSAAWVAAATKP